MSFAPLKSALLFLVVLAMPAKLSAHEFWISPQSYTVAPGEPILADLRVGQKFDAPAYAYIDFNITRFNLIQNGVVTKVTGRMGDLPALQMAAPGDGLVTVVHETSDNLLKWDDFEKFKSFVAHKDLKGTLEAHTALGLPPTGFKETYRRFVKSLVKVGTGTGQDIETGMRTEIIALANPYTDDVGAGFPVKLMFEQAIWPDAQIEVFEKAPDGSVVTTTVRTNGDGIAVVPVRPGMEYMLDAVHMAKTGGDFAKDEPVFESLWANLTFKVPD